MSALGCGESARSMPPASTDAAQLLVTCSPAGPRLLARDELADEATVGRAALALWLEAHADDPRRGGKLHPLLTAALLSGLDAP